MESYHRDGWVMNDRLDVCNDNSLTYQKGKQYPCLIVPGWDLLGAAISVEVT